MSRQNNNMDSAMKNYNNGFVKNTASHLFSSKSISPNTLLKDAQNVELKRIF